MGIEKNAWGHKVKKTQFKSENHSIDFMEHAMKVIERQINTYVLKEPKKLATTQEYSPKGIYFKANLGECLQAHKL